MYKLDDTPWIKENWIKISKLVFNEETKRYDCNGWLTIYDENLIDGHFPIPLGVIKGNFECDKCDSFIPLSKEGNYSGHIFDYNSINMSFPLITANTNKKCPAYEFYDLYDVKINYIKM